MTLKQFLSINRSWSVNDAGLLCLRILMGLSLFFHHGWEKLSGFSKLTHHFFNPLHIGVVPSLLFSTVGDGICSLLVVLGLATRIASIWVLVNLSVVYFVVMHALSPQLNVPPRPASSIEMVYLYLTGFLLLAIAGAGKFSLDARLS